MANRLIAALLALSFATVSVGQQKVPPTDADFHAAYCISLLDEEISFLQKAVVELDTYTKNLALADFSEFGKVGQQHLERWSAGIMRLEKVRQRLSAYLTPRMTLLDFRARSEANLAAQTDWGDFVMMDTDGCQEERVLAPGGLLQVHMNFCTNASLIARVQSCRNPAWLPRSL